MKLRLSALAAMTAVIAATSAPAVSVAQSALTPAGNDWPYTTGNLGSHGYTSLTQINKSNVRNLGLAWMTHTGAEAVTSPVARPGNNGTAQQTTPIVVDGTMYLNPPGGGAMALNAATGAVKWKWVPNASDPAPNNFGPATQQRGVAYGEDKIFTTAGGSRVVALNKETGAVIWAVQPAAANGETIAGIAKVRPMYYKAPGAPYGLVFMGNNDNNRGAFVALRADTGAVVWTFFSTYPHGSTFTDVNGTTFDAGDSFTTKVTPNDTPNECWRTAGATPWQGGTIDPELGMVYVPFGNVRSCNGSQNGEGRPGDNLFGSSIVALDLNTGAYKWHFQAVKHDIWDMDNALPATLADVSIGGQVKKVLLYGSKSAFSFTLDRATGKPVQPVEYRAVAGDSRNNPALTQPFPLQNVYSSLCVNKQNLGSEVPGDQNRIAPNWNGFQAEPDPANPGQYRLVYKTPNYLTAEEPFMVGPPRNGCLYDGAYEGFVYVFPPSQNGGNDMTNVSYSPKLSMHYVGLSYMPGGHPLQQGGNGLRMIGGYQSGAILGVNSSTGQVAWYKRLVLDLSRQHNPLVTATDLLFHTQMDGYVIGRDAATGDEVWRFSMGAPSQAGTISYMVNGEQYIATTNMAGSQPYSQQGNGDAVFAWKLGGTAKYYTGTRANPTIVSGSQEAPNALPIPNIRRPVDNAAAGIVPANEIWMARSNGTATSAPDSVATASMIPSTRSVPVGTTVTFRNPGVETFPNAPNVKEHCATQYFEGKFNFRLQPGQTAEYKFDKEGEYFYNDCTDPRPTGKVLVTLAPEPTGLQIVPNVLNLRSPTGVHTGVQGLITAVMTVPAGWKLDIGPVGLGDPTIGSVVMKAPLTTKVFTAVSATLAANGTSLVATFNKGDIDHNVPEGDAVPLVISANFVDASGVQRKLQGTANVRTVK